MKLGANDGGSSIVGFNDEDGTREGFSEGVSVGYELGAIEFEGASDGASVTSATTSVILAQFGTSKQGCSVNLLLVNLRS